MNENSVVSLQTDFTEYVNMRLLLSGGQVYS